MTTPTIEQLKKIGAVLLELGTVMEMNQTALKKLHPENAATHLPPVTVP